MAQLVTILMLTALFVLLSHTDGYGLYPAQSGAYGNYPNSGYNSYNPFYTMLEKLRIKIERDVKSMLQKQSIDHGKELAFYRAGGGPVSVSLLGGQNNSLGAVVLSRQIHYRNPNSIDSGWLCDDDFDDSDDKGPDVVCRMLGFTSGTFIDGNLFVDDSIADRNFKLDDVECFGDETNIIDCQNDGGWNPKRADCSPDEIAGVICFDSI